MSNYDYIIVGSGIAGLSAAIFCSYKGKVALVTKEPSLLSGNSYLAQGGIAASEDTQLHYEDTIRASGTTSDPKVVQFFVENAYHAYIWLKDDIKVPFKKNPKLEGGHSINRVRSAGDNSGEVISQCLINRVKDLDNIEILTGFNIDKLTTNQGINSVKVIGVSGIRNKTKLSLTGNHIVLATGGIGQSFKKTSNNLSSTGDGINLAKQVGAEIEHLDWVQWHPTGLNVKANPVPIISETLRGDGAFIVNQHGERFLRKYHKDGELAPRDVIVDAMKKEGECGNKNYLDLRYKPQSYWTLNYPHITSVISSYGIDIQKDLIPIIPVEHFLCGGIKVDLTGKTTIPGLYAIGEVSSSGLHGKNRLASNALAECVIWAKSFADST